jgi:hypothetical protein
VTSLDFTVQDTTIARTMRLTQGHIAGGRLPVPPAIREQLAPGETITVTLILRPGFRAAGTWRTEQQRTTLAGITWPDEITPGTKADVSVQWTDGRTRRVAVVVDELAPVPTRRRRTRAAKPRPAARAAVEQAVSTVQGNEVLSRDIVTTAQVHGATRVIEFAVIRHTLGDRSWSTYRVTAYDSRHREPHPAVGIGPADTLDQIADARRDAATLLDPSGDPDYCDCWSGWDPECGKPACWGVVTR